MTDTNPPAKDFDGCNSQCRRAGKHTLAWGLCEHATPPAPTVSMSKIYTDPDDGYPSIGFDTYTVPELARLIEPSLGDPLKAAAAARAIVHRNDVEQPVAAELDDTDLTETDIDRMMAAGVPVQIVTGPPATFRANESTASTDLASAAGQNLRFAAASAPANRAALRDRIAEALRPGSRDRSGQYPEGLLRDVDAVLAVLPEPTNQAAILREAEAALRVEAKRMTGEFNDSDILHEDGPAAAVATWKHAADLLRRLADAASGPGGVAGETPQPEPAFAPGMPCEHGCRAAADELTRETCGRTWSTSGDEYPPCARPVDHREAYCRSADGQSHFIGTEAAPPAAVSQPDGEA